MRCSWLFIVMTCISQYLPGQTNTLQNIIPPSPEAISISRISFSDVDLYTGKVNYSIPLYTISQNGISFPVSLNYVGGGGIKVEEVASSAGLGWSLQSTGAISRSVRGIADDAYAGNYIGYMHLPEFPQNTPENNNTYVNLYGANKYDAQPDLFTISAPGLSGSFYINKEKKVVFIEKGDLKVDLVFDGYKLICFIVKDLAGNTYHFDATEETRSIPYDTQPEYNLYDVSSWQLSKIFNKHGKEIITFIYDNKENNIIKQILRSPYQYKIDEVVFDHSRSTTSDLYYKRPVLQKIQWAQGEVNFKMSAATRYDLAGDRYIDSVIVKNAAGNIIKRFNLDYSYFTTSGTIQEGQGQYYSFGDPGKRLKLDILEDISLEGEKLAYSFEYDTSHFLPDRQASFAMDHWGYYNGASTNTGWEPKHRIKWYNMAGTATLQEYGSANRTPDITYATAGVLKKIYTPLGGQYEFEYENHTSTDTKLPNPLFLTNLFYTLDNAPNFFTINLINEPFAYTTVRALVQEPGYSIEYTIKDSAQATTYFADTLVQGDAIHSYKLYAGKYCIKARLLGAHPDPDFNYGPRLIYETESAPLHKLVGGIRLRKMRLHEPATGKSLVRNYYYNEAGQEDINSPSTGAIAGAPKYGHQRVFYFQGSNIFDWEFIADGYLRQVSSSYPLQTSSGNHIGYRMVTTIDSNELKTQYEFTSFLDFPELSSRENESIAGKVLDGVWQEAIPLAPFDERNFLRGKLKKQVVFRKEQNAVVKISQTENTYIHNWGMRTKKNQVVLPDTVYYLPGMIFTNDAGSLLLTTYYLYTGKYDLQKTVNINYSYSQGTPDSLVSETTYQYGDTRWYIDSLFHYQPTKIITRTSTGMDTAIHFYPYHWRYPVADITTADTPYLKRLEVKNEISVPVLTQVKTSTGIQLKTEKLEFDDFNTDQLNIRKAKIKYLSNTNFEDLVYFNQFDTLGNITEQQKANDAKQSYIWGYNNSYPVAQVNGAAAKDIFHTSFEDIDGNSTDGDSKTGKKSRTGGYSKSLSGLTNGSYLLTWWQKSGNNWSLQTNVVTVSGGTYTINLSSQVDEIRFYPQGAQMTTYTYVPLIGLTSQCDANNRIIYYEYDGFGRLKLIRDQDRNVLKTFDYKYQQPLNQ